MNKKEKKCIIFLLILLMMISGCRSSVNDEDVITFTEQQVFEYDKNFLLSSLITSIGYYQPKDFEINEDDTLIMLPNGSTVTINTENKEKDLGVIEFTFLYKNKKFYKKVEFQDTTAPIIDSKNSYEVEKDNPYFDLKKEIGTSDNYNDSNQIELFFNGSYSISKPGDYTIEVVAYDQQKNQSKKEIKVSIVEEKHAQIAVSQTKPYEFQEQEENQSSEISPSHQQPTPSSQFFSIGVYGSFDSCMNACKASLRGYSGGCEPVKDDDGIYIGYQSYFD